MNCASEDGRRHGTAPRHSSRRHPRRSYARPISTLSLLGEDGKVLSSQYGHNRPISTMTPAAGKLEDQQLGAGWKHIEKRCSEAGITVHKPSRHFAARYPRLGRNTISYGP